MDVPAGRPGDVPGVRPLQEGGLDPPQGGRLPPHGAGGRGGVWGRRLQEPHAGVGPPPPHGLWAFLNESQSYD